MIKIPYQLGDGNNDYYHPFIRINNNLDEKHVLCLKNDDDILIDPSYFDFEFLDTSAGRFKIFVNNDIKKREHPILCKDGTKPYYLEDLDNFTKLWEILNDKKYKITSSQINNLNALLISKIHDWNIKEGKPDNMPEFGDMVENSVVNILRIDKKEYLFSLDDVPGNDSERLLKYLVDDLKMDWVKNAKVNKSDNGNDIIITDGKNSSIFKLNKKENKVNLEINGGKNYEYILKEENGNLNIYKEDNFKFIKDAILSGLFFDVIELYTKIMKEKIGGKQNE